MTTTLPQQRDLWVLIIVAILGAVAGIALRPSSVSPGDVAGGASPAPYTTPAPSDVAVDTNPVQPPSLDSLPADTREQLQSLPAGTVLVACGATFAKYPDGVIPEAAVGWRVKHPAWRVLLHGYCVDDPSAIGSFEPAIMPVP